MKFLKIFLVVILIFIVLAVAAAAILIKTFDVNRFKPQIIGQAGPLLNRAFDFDKANLAFSFRQGISLKVSNLAIGEDPAFGTSDFLSVKSIAAGMDVIGYLREKKVSVSSIVVESPRIVIIRAKDGRINAQTIGPKPAQQNVSGAKNAPAASALAIPALFVSSIQSTNGAVTFIDRSSEPPLRLEISDLSLRLDKVSLTGPFPFVAEAALLSAKKNIRIEGKAQIDLATNTITIVDLKGSTELADILLQKITTVFPQIQAAMVPTSLKGKLDVSAPKITLGPAGLTNLAADVSLANASLQSSALASPIKDITLHAAVTENNITVDKATAAIGDGAIIASGTIEDYPAAQRYTASAQVKDLKVQDVMAQASAPIQAEGIASGTMKVKGAGFTPAALQSSLSGAGELSMIKGKLKGLNIVRTVLDKISVIPGLSERIQANLPERFKTKLAQHDTVLSDIKLPVSAENGRLVVNNAVLGTDECIFTGTAEAGFDAAYALEGVLLIQEEFSAAMVAAVPELQYLLNDAKQISIPLKISGRAGAPQFTVDKEYIVRKLLAEQGKKQIFKALDKAWGTKEPPAAGPDVTNQNVTEAGSQQPADAGKKPSTEEAVKDILRGIFK